MGQGSHQHVGILGLLGDRAHDLWALLLQVDKLGKKHLKEAEKEKGKKAKKRRRKKRNTEKRRRNGPRRASTVWISAVTAAHPCLMTARLVPTVPAGVSPIRPRPMRKGRKKEKPRPPEGEPLQGCSSQSLEESAISKITRGAGRAVPVPPRSPAPVAAKIIGSLKVRHGDAHEGAAMMGGPEDWRLQGRRLGVHKYEGATLPVWGLAQTCLPLFSGNASWQPLAPRPRVWDHHTW